MEKLVWAMGMILSLSAWEGRGEDLSAYETYLNTLHRIEAHLIQESADGSTYAGYVWLEKPDKLRIEYDPTHSLTLVARKGDLYTYDHATGDLNSCDVKETPASFFLRPSLQLKGDVMVKEVVREGGVVRLTLVQTEDKESGALTLVFQEAPLELRQWVVRDSSGQETKVTLSHLKSHSGKGSFPADLFNPKLVSRRFMPLSQDGYAHFIK
jgi:outer membrane lipoprotein-sorting protein